MSTEQFTKRVDGIVNDYKNGISDGKEFRNQICDLLIGVAQPCLPDSDAETFAFTCACLEEKSEESNVFQLAVLRVAAQILHDKYDLEDVAHKISGKINAEIQSL